ncbi:hypothetical protein BU24DRAFT_420227 [Aaosphaeria arxii CBS 175.79]|uniref:Thioesterase domain-containing protein n=1 Tax=Aaosphaeria arxii CBS 175.79 TaxID=1450172 RepID=A0A6A5XV50_9PLEO|nr:uncharacterized protein BU24DRAFT_420227 [Aaosphaeria arxii CBS 175.79]KAF2017195.1 hypothetical protein BU24DRAFT_420227 [Aaosphaeria arxii CBS 175.79]
MNPTPVDLEPFSSVKWALPQVTSPGWSIGNRYRAESHGLADYFCRDIITSNSGVSHWVEAYQKPSTDRPHVEKSISLFSFGKGLGGYSGICHGGALMTMMDEALGYTMVKDEIENKGSDWSGEWLERLKKGESLSDFLVGFMLTAKLDFTFFAPVVCPGVIGIEVELIEHKGHRMKLQGTMRDAKGRPLLKAVGTWVRLSRAAKM